MTRKGEHITEEHRKKISDSLKKIQCETRFKKGHQTWLGKKLPEWMKQKLSVAHKGKPAHNKGTTASEETKKKLSLSHMGQSPWNKGKPQSEEACRKMSVFQKNRMQDPEERRKRSEQLKGKSPSEETREKLRIAHLGEKSVHWRGGISFEPYCVKFNNEFKERVRAFFGRCCVVCGTPQTGKKHHVHHVNFNKMSCCDDTDPLFVSLCHSCHSKTNFNREYWEQHFTDMINTYYGGKCYLSKEEMIALTNISYVSLKECDPSLPLPLR